MKFVAVLLAIAACGDPPLGPDTVTLALSRSGSGSGAIIGPGVDCGENCRPEFPAGTRLALVAKPDIGSGFFRWRGLCEGTGTCEVELVEDVGLEAEFFPDLREIFVQLDGPGTVEGIECPNNNGFCDEQFPHGSIVRLTAVPTPTARFVTWSNFPQCTSNPTCEILVDNSYFLIAQFQELASITVFRGGLGSGRIVSEPAGIDCGTDCNGVFEPFAAITLRAIADPGSHFSAWGNCNFPEEDAAGPFCTLNVFGPASVTAYFAPGD